MKINQVWFLGDGRPFFVKLKNPLKRNLKLKSTKFDFIQILNPKIIPESPKNSLKFNSVIKIKISTESEIHSSDLRKLKDLVNFSTIVYEKSGKRSEKKFFSVRYSKLSKHKISLIIKAEGGLPIKRFVTGDDVSPGISRILNNQCQCQEFDFLEIELQS